MYHRIRLATITTTSDLTTSLKKPCDRLSVRYKEPENASSVLEHLRRTTKLFHTMSTTIYIHFVIQTHFIRGKHFFIDESIVINFRYLQM